MKLISGISLVVLLTTNLNAQSNMESVQSLDSKQQSFVSISALTATGDVQQLRLQLASGLDAGLTVNEIKEALVQLYAYCGFPRSLNAINTFMSVLEERKRKGISDIQGREATQIKDSNKYQTGKQTLQKLTGSEEKITSGANAFAPAIDTFLKEHLFADIFSRDVLTYKQRELVTVCALAAMTGVEPQLQAHISIALNTELTYSQLYDAFQIIDTVVNKRQGDIARGVLGRVMEIKKSL